MNRRLQKTTAWCLCVLTLASGCTPTQPFFYKEDGDLSHYMNMATEIDYPEVSEQPLDDVAGAKAPLTVANAENFVIWDLSLEEVIRRTLENSQVLRDLAQVSDFGSNRSNAPETITSAPDQATTSFDPALAESGYGGSTGSPLSGTGVEAALSEFDAQLDSSLSWSNNDRPQNFGLAAVPNFFAPQFRQDLGRGSMGITKTAPTGTTFEVRNNYAYDQNNNGSRIQPSDWNVNVETAITQPLLQGAGLQYNRISGPRSFQEYSGGFADQIDGVLISRIRYDITLTDFQRRVLEVVHDTEDAYWELYFTYRDLDARKIGRDSAAATWQRVNTLARAGSVGGEANAEAQARSQYYRFRAQVESSLNNVFRAEGKLRYMMGIAATDGRLIRPIDEPTTAQVHFDWAAIHAEALSTRVELRRERWQIKRRELELIAARNQLLPRLDAVGRYRWLGAGDELIDSGGTGVPPFGANSNAFETLTGGDYQEWELGLNFTMPIGMRRGMTAVRHHQLLLAREKAIMQEMEAEIVVEISEAVRDLDMNYGVAQTNFNSRAAADDEVEAVETLYKVGQITLDRVLDAQSRQAEAESAYYRSLVDYNRAIMQLHFRKGSLLEYNGVYLAEGPWPGKAYFDALRRARQRDASMYVNYGYSRPDVISRGPIPQISGASNGAVYQGPASGGDVAPQESMGPEPIPAPTGDPLGLAPAADVTLVQYIEPLPAVSEPLTTFGPATAASPPVVAPAPVAPSTTPNYATPIPSNANPGATGSAPLPANPFLNSAPAPAPSGLSYEPHADYATAEIAAGAAGG